MSYRFDNLRLEKGMYNEAGRTFTQVLERETLQAIAKRRDEPQLEELRMAFQRQADKTWGLEPQLKGLEERDFGQRDGAF